jgi:transposase
MIKFLDILGRYEALEFNQLEAAELLGVGERTLRRWCQRHEEDGEAGLLDRRLGKASGRRVPVDRADEVEALYRTRYAGFTAKHFHEHLVDHRFNWSYSWTKTFLLEFDRVAASMTVCDGKAEIAGSVRAIK